MSKNYNNKSIIKSLTINFRKLQNQKIDFGKKFTLISGHNGTMKSTILGLLIQPFNNSRWSNEDMKKFLIGIDGTFDLDYRRSISMH